jgi:hypothetical protein
MEKKFFHRVINRKSVMVASSDDQQKGRRRSKKREIFCPAHPEKRITGNGKKYFLHLLTSEQLRQRGMPDKKARLIINAYPVLVLSNEWLEELFFLSAALLVGAMLSVMTV